MKVENMDNGLIKVINDNRLKVLIPIFSCSLIAFLCLKDFSKLNYITVLEDEFGYWGTAASIAGYDWKELIAETSYYSYGYSLLLVPIILLLPTVILWYKAAIILNVLLLLLSYFICIKIGKELFSEIDDKFIMIVSLLVTIYPSNIAYAQVAWTETLQFFLVWWITYLIVKLDKQFSMLRILEIILLVIYLFCVHNRNIGVVAVAMLCILLCLWKHKKPTIYYIIPVGLLIFSFFSVKLIKNYEVEVLWSNSSASEVNNLSISSSTFSSYFMSLFNHFKSYFESLYGKLFYLLLATGFTLPIVVLNVVKEVASNVRKWDIFKDYLISKVWCVGILIIMWLLSALQILEWTGRKDYIVYARYMEQTIGPILLLGIIYTFIYTKKIRTGILLSVIFFLVGMNGIYKKMDSVNVMFNSICAPLFGAFYDNNDSLEKAFAWIIIATEVMIVGVLVSTFIRVKSIRFVLPIVIYIIVFSIEGFYSSTFMNQARDYYESRILPIYEQVIQCDQKEIYYVKDNASCTNPKYLQFMIPDHKIYLIEREEISSVLTDDRLILINPMDGGTESFLLDLDEGNFDRLASTALLGLYKNKVSE